MPQGCLGVARGSRRRLLPLGARVGSRGSRDELVAACAYTMRTFGQGRATPATILVMNQRAPMLEVRSERCGSASVCHAPRCLSWGGGGGVLHVLA